MAKIFLGYKIFNTLQDFYNWQGYDESPEDGTVNKIMGFSTANIINSIRFTIPMPHSSVTSVVYDSLRMPTSIIGSDLRVLSPITDDCPGGSVPMGLLAKEAVEGWGLEAAE